MAHIKTALGILLVCIAFLALLYYAQKDTPAPPAPVATSTTIGVPFSTGVQGTVLLGPTCPVESDKCADKPYQAAVSVYRAGTTKPLATMRSREDGSFEFALSAGEYRLVAETGTVLPRCAPLDVTVPEEGYAKTTIYCDSGIR